MHIFLLGLLFLICLFLPYVFKKLEGMEYSTTDLDMLPKLKDESGLIRNDSLHSSNADVDVSRLQSHAGNLEPRTQALF